MAKKKTAPKKKAAPSKKKAAKKAPKKAAATTAKAAKAKVKAKAKAKAAKGKAKTGIAALPAEKQVVGGVLLGAIEDYFAHVSVMALKLLAPISVGDMIRIKGHTTDITQKVESMQVDHQPVQTAAVGDSIGIKIADRARAGDAVYKI